MKYQSSSTHCSKVIGKVKAFKKGVNLPGQGLKVKNIGTHGKVLSQEIFMLNIKALALTVQVIGKVKFFKKWVKLQSQGHKVKNNVPKERSYHRKYSCEIPKL